MLANQFINNNLGIYSVISGIKIGYIFLLLGLLIICSISLYLFFRKNLVRMGEGVLKESVPEAHTDYIIAVIAEEFGSIISIIVITIFLYISYKIIKNCFKTSDENSKIALCGLSSLLIFQTFIHLGVNTSLLPTTGMTLPFLSYGGSSLIGSSILAGVILNFTKKDLRMNDFKKDIIIATGGTADIFFLL